jgi:hypothetical protein
MAAGSNDGNDGPQPSEARHDTRDPSMNPRPDLWPVLRLLVLVIVVLLLVLVGLPAVLGAAGPA